MLVQELIDWLGQTNEISNLFFFKLNFAQACDKMNWEFLFRAMVKMGVPKKLLLKKIKARVYFDGAIIVSLQIK